VLSRSAHRVFAGARDLSERLAAGALPPEKAAVAPQLVLNRQIDGGLTVFFAALLWIIVLDMAYTVWGVIIGWPVLPLRESAAASILELIERDPQGQDRSNPHATGCDGRGRCSANGARTTLMSAISPTTMPLAPSGRRCSGALHPSASSRAIFPAALTAAAETAQRSHSRRRCA
jgi:hypothetical protein